jgi:hypothetical protein
MDPKGNNAFAVFSPNSTFAVFSPKNVHYQDMHIVNARYLQEILQNRRQHMTAHEQQHATSASVPQDTPAQPHSHRVEGAPAARHWNKTLK